MSASTKRVSDAPSASAVLRKKARKEARKAEEAAAGVMMDAAGREAATAAFLAQREQEAAAKAEAKAAKKTARAEAEQAKASAKKAAKKAAGDAKTIGGGDIGNSGKPGDWQCACGAHVFASRSTCYKCGAAGGNAKPGDWTCGSCGVNVFASKSACFKCGTPKEGGAPAADFAGSPSRKVASGGRDKYEAHAQMALDLGLEDVHATCKDCASPFVVKASEQACFREKGFGVTVRVRCTECTAAKKQRYGGQYGHSGGTEANGELKCFNCGRAGHASRDCPDERKVLTCYLCGEAGHTSRACPTAPKASKAGAMACFHCGKEGHISRNCPTAGPMVCFRCKKPGHMSKDCRA